jgi:hypothetical protein
LSKNAWHWPGLCQRCRHCSSRCRSLPHLAPSQNSPCSCNDGIAASLQQSRPASHLRSVRGQCRLEHGAASCHAPTPPQSVLPHEPSDGPQTRPWLL